MAIVYKPKNRKHARAHGFHSRTKTKGGRNTIKRRMQRGRKKLGV
jgi:large subunit ribosomal protein L34